MSTLTLDYTNCLATSIGATHGLTESEIETLVAKFPKHHETMEELRASKETGFFDLPYQDTKAVKDLIKDCKGQYTDLVIIGIGGATVGPASLFGALLHPNWNLLTDKARKGAPRVHLVGNADPVTLNSTLEVVDLKKTLFLIVSRSGNTAETSGIFLWLKEQLKRKNGKTALAKQIVLATNAEHSALVEIAEKEKIRVLDIPSNLSDRFNVLGPATLLPAGLCGLDIDQLLAGAEAMDKRCRMDRAMENPAYMHSLIHYLLTRKRRKTIHAMMAFSDRLYAVVEWYSHLLSVSLGKMLNRKGKAVHVGPSPASCSGPSGCYGQMQLYQEGPFDKVLTFLTVSDHGADIALPKIHGNIEGVGYLAGSQLSTIIDDAYIGAAHTITASGRPNLTIAMDVVDAHNIGGLYFMLQLSTTMSAELYGIDPFDQPGVDTNKQAVFAQLGRAGFEDKAAALKEFRAKDRQTC